MRRSFLRDITINELREISTPIFQRQISDSHVDDLYNFHMGQKYETGYVEPLGVLVTATLNNKIYIIDGQHRRKAYLRLNDYINQPIQVIIQNWNVSSEEEMKELFIQLNKNCPIPDYVKSSSGDKKKAADILIDYIQKHYKSYLSSSNRPQFPNINLQIFQEVIEHLPFYSDITSDKAIELFESFNNQCRSLLQNSSLKEDRDRFTKNKGKSLWINRAIKEYYSQKHQLD
jgi:hypothetical protein